MAVIPMLTPNNAVLTTATIEVAVLRLDKRQVTMSVFRQVHERSPTRRQGRADRRRRALGLGELLLERCRPAW
jgi:hypothetical protein